MGFRPKGQAAFGDSCGRLRGSRLKEQTPPPDASATEARLRNRLPAWYLNEADTLVLMESHTATLAQNSLEQHRVRAARPRQKSIFARNPTISDGSARSRKGVIIWRSGVTWHQGVTVTL